MKTPEITVIDYGVGNLLSVSRGLEHCGAKVNMSSDPDFILKSKKVILPGVGAFPNGMRALIELGLDTVIKEVVNNCVPLLGICLGMQLLLEESEEFGSHLGLALIEGKVTKFPNMNDNLKIRVPHIGWNKLSLEDSAENWKDTPLKDISEDDFMYFIHSYYACPLDKRNVFSNSIYRNIEFCSSVKKDNIFGFQFHPEKSCNRGITIYKNFLEL